MFRNIFKIILLLIISSFGISKNISSVDDIYTIEDDSSYSLIIDYDSKSPIEYTVRENFDPPTLIILISNFKWERGNFTRKSAHSPLYQFDVNSINNIKSKMVSLDVLKVKILLHPLVFSGTNFKKLN